MRSKERLASLSIISRKDAKAQRKYKNFLFARVKDYLSLLVFSASIQRLARSPHSSCKGLPRAAKNFASHSVNVDSSLAHHGIRSLS